MTLATPTLFDALAADVLADTPAPVRRGQPNTSTLAAARVRTGSGKARVLAALVAAGERGATDYELARAAGIPRMTTAGTRRHELQQLGLVVPTGDRRPTDTGALAVVWVASGAGRRVWTQIEAQS